MVWASNYKRYGGTDESAKFSLEYEVPSIQFYTMCLMYQKLDGEKWENQDKWLQTDRLCGWFGISCIFEGLVTGIQLPANGLKGTIPPEILHIPFLRKKILFFIVCVVRVHASSNKHLSFQCVRQESSICLVMSA